MLKPSMSRFRLPRQMSSASIGDDVMQEVENIPGDTWIEKIRFAFNEVDEHHAGQVTMEQFCRSRLNILLYNYRLSELQMAEQFKQIDSNCDDVIQWSELVDFLRCLQKTEGGEGLEKNIKISYVAPSEMIIKKHHKSSICLRTMFIPALGQIVTLTETQMTFYSIGDCVPSRIFQDHENFVDFTYMPCIYRLAIVKQNRQVIFYDIRNMEKSPFFISASIDASAVPHMTTGEARIASKWCNRRNIPLFNTPSSICAVPDEPTFFIGDEAGKIEVFTIVTSREAKHNWEARRIHSYQMHGGVITQMMYCPTIEKYISASTDGTICIWKYDIKTAKIYREDLFREPNKLGIRSFVYDVRTRDLVYTTAAHCFGVWRTFTPHQQTISTHSQVISTLEIYQMSRDVSFLIVISKDNFVSVYRMPEMDLTGSWYMGLQHDLCPPTGCVILDQYFFLAGAFLSCWRLENSECDGLRPHVHKMLKVMVNDTFKTVISVDRHGDVNVWNVLDGRKNFGYSVHEEGAKVVCVALDESKRRMAVGYSDGRLKLFAANSGSQLCECDRTYIEGGCINVNFTTIFGQKRMLVCTGSKAIVMFEDLTGSRLRYSRSFVGHTDNLSMVIGMKGNFVLSIGMDHEMFLWNIQAQNPVVKFKMPADPTVAVDISSDPKKFIVGDVNGYIHFMSKDSPVPLSSMNAFELSVKSPVTSLEITPDYPLVVAGNGHGYVKYWILQEDNKIEELRRFRGHNESVHSVSVSQRNRVVVTMGADEFIRMWSVEPFGLIGSFGTGRVWKTNHIDTWESDQPLPDDPCHFIERTEEALEAAIRAAHEEEEEEEHVEIAPKEIEIPPFSLDIMQDLMDDLENICLSGRTTASNAKKVMPPEYPLTDRPRQFHFEGNVPPIFNSVIKKQKMGRTIRELNDLISNKKIVRPSTGRR